MSGTPKDQERHLAYYRKSAESHDRLRASARSRQVVTPAQRRAMETHGHQMQKDERFWIVTALETLFDRADRVDAFAELFRRSTGNEPNGTIWAELMGDPADLRLYFEVDLPAPQQYLAAFREGAKARIFLPWLQDRARSRTGARLEGTTKVDALLVPRTNGFAATFEPRCCQTSRRTPRTTRPAISSPGSSTCCSTGTRSRTSR